MSFAGYAEVRRRTAGIERTVREIAALIGEAGLGLDDSAALLEERANALSQALFTIVVIGEFKSGKSTLLNGMLGSGTLPAKATPCTAIITVLVRGESERVTIYQTDRAEPRILDWDEFTREFQLSLEDQETLDESGVLDRFASVQYAQIESDHPLCRDGVRLVDSPGLGEHISRTRVATSYLKQSQAVIFLLNATRILGAGERSFIENELPRARRGNVFFVVNRMDQIDPAAEEEIRAWVDICLSPYFADDEGQVDWDLYRERVYFVSAKRALTARTDPAVDAEELAASGVPELEQALERFLTGEDKVTAALSSTVDVVDPIVTRALEHLERQQRTVDEPVAALEARHEEAERQLRGLQSRKAEIERTISLFGDVIRQKVFTDLRGYVGEMEERWPEDSRQLIDLDSAVSLKNLLTSYAQPEAKERMAQAIHEQIQRYLQIKFGQWLERVPAAVQHDIDMMLAEVEAQIDEFQLALDEIAMAFSGSTSVQRTGSAHPAHLMDLALTMSDVHGVTDSMMYPSDWTAVVGTMAQQAVAVFLVGTFLTGGNFLIALVAVEALHLGVHDHEAKKHLRTDLGRRLHGGLREQIQGKRPFVYDSIGRRFDEFGRAMTEALQREIDGVRSEQERILRQRRDEHFSAEKERGRLQQIGQRLLELRSDLITAVSV